MIESDDFTIAGNDQQTISLPRSGAAKQEAAFDIEPKKNGSGTIKVFFYANRRVFRKMTIGLQVGATLEVNMASGISLASALAMPLRQQDEVVNLIINKLEDGYQFTVKHSTVTSARINLSEAQLDELAARARQTLKDIVYLQGNNQYIYQQEGSVIDPLTHAATLKSLARMGFYLYERLFFAPGNGRDAHTMGALLRKLSQHNQLRIHIQAGRFFFPWSLLYDRDTLNPDNIDPRGFWGFKHVIEHLPLLSQIHTYPDAQLRVDDRLGLGFVCNNTIDTQLRAPLIGAQHDAFAEMPGVTLFEYPNRQDLLHLLNDPDTPLQMLYIYAHAVSNLPGEKGGIADSKIVLTDGPLSLEELAVAAPVSSSPFKLAPLVFFNSTQTAELSFYAYDGLVPYLLAKGCRGVIGTEVDMPAYFAAEFGVEFVKRFSAGGMGVGELLLDLRREYLDGKNNVLGLVYVYYGDANLAVQRSLT